MAEDLFTTYDRTLYKTGTAVYNPDLPAENVQATTLPSVDYSQVSSSGSSDQQNLYVGAIVAGKQGFTNNETGYILGVDKGIPKFFIGSTTKYINWDGVNLTIIGGVSVSSLDIPDTTTANSFHVDTSGNAWWGTNVATGYATAPARILNTGAATFSNITATGGTIGGFTLSSTTLTATNLSIDSSGQRISLGSGNDIVILDADDATYRLWTGHATAASAPFSVTKAGLVTASNITITGGSVAVSTLNGTISLGNLNVAAQGWSQTCVFSVTDADTVAWGSGTFTTAAGTAYSISAGNTGNMVAKTYIYLDTNISTTVYQTTTTASTAVGAGKALVAIAQNGTGEATFTVMSGMGGQNIDASSIVANSITANELSTSIVYAGSIVIDTAGNIRSGQTAYETGTGWFIGNVIGTPKLSIGNTTNFLKWNGTSLAIAGTFNIGGTQITIDNTQDIQTNLNTISSAGGGTLFLQAGTYTLSADVSIPSGVTLEGISRDGVIIDCNTSYAVKIMGSNVYSTGTVTINNGDTTVVGSGTTWISGMIGRYIFLDGSWYLITARTDNTHITIDTYQGINLAGASYVLATINFNASLNKVTVTGATGDGIAIQYASEPNVKDIVVTGCGTGLNYDYVTAPQMVVASDDNGVNLDMNYVRGFYINFSEFNRSTTGAGIVMNNSGNATFFNSSVADNTGNGISATDCDKISYISYDISGNGAKGIEFISGCDDNQILSGVIENNVSDGIKFTATSDRNSIVAVSITGSGGYGINIAASTCDNNQIIAPAFLSNTSGNINDSGTSTFISPQEFQNNFSVQDVPISTGTTATGNQVCFASDTTGTVLFFAENNTSGTVNIYRLLQDTVTNNYYITHSVTLSITTTLFGGIGVAGNYLYVWYNAAGSIKRYDKVDLANATDMTGTIGNATNASMFSDGTNLYLHPSANGNGAFDKYTISGTGVTNSSTITYTSAGATMSSISDGINVYITDTSGTGTLTIRKYPLAGGAATSTFTQLCYPDVYLNGANNRTIVALFIASPLMLGIGWEYNSTSASAVIGLFTHLTAISLP